MTTTTILTMILILGFVWGGLIWLVVTAVRKEQGKQEAAEPGSS